MEDCADTEADVFIQLFDERGNTGRRRLYKTTNGNRNKFQLGQHDIFEIEAVELIDLTKVEIGHNSTEAGKEEEYGVFFITLHDIMYCVSYFKLGLNLMQFFVL